MTNDTTPAKRRPILEQRRVSRQKVCLPLRILGAGGPAKEWTGQTRDMSTGGVSFVTQDALSVGSVIEYVITLSDNNPPVRISCVGKILRCTKNDNGGADVSYEAAATMERYGFVAQEDARLPVMARAS